MKPGYIAGSAPDGLPAALKTAEDQTSPAGNPPALPPEQPLAMPRQAVHGPRQRMRPGGKAWSRIFTGISRMLLIAGTGGLSAYGAIEMHGVMATGGITLLQWIFLVLFAVNFAWVGFAACQAVLGFVRQLVLSILPRRKPAEAPSAFQTAILVPVYNEAAPPVAAAIAAMADGLRECAPGRFHFFILSDSTCPDAWISEEAVFAALIADANEACPVYYRHRSQNTERKAGNIADWVTRWGGSYDAMLVLDADSLMAPETVIEMARRLEDDPGLGLLQSLPAIVRAQSLYARLQQFANRCYGPIFGNGLAVWHGRTSNFWGHNAIIRTEAFAASAHLPKLSGAPPFGGPVMSHDFIEAALLRRAGWGVRMDTDLEGSFEEAPPALTDVLVRDRRWCQGNLQHGRFLFARGLPLCTRLHLLSGMMGYLSAPLWFALLVVGIVIAIQAGLARPEYFSGRALFPTWPVFDSERAIALFVISMFVVLAPKALGWLAAMLNPRQLMGFGGPVALIASVATEVLLSALYAPILMVAQSNIVRQVVTGGDSGWKPQRRGDGRMALTDALRAHRWHTGLGVGLGLLAYVLNPDLFLWLLPVTAGLVLSAPLSWISGSARLGTLLRRLAILRTGEEKQKRRPAILAAYEKQLNRYSSPAAASLEILANDPALRDWHLAQLGARNAHSHHFHAPLILARAKAERANDIAALEKWMTAEEAMAFLHDSDLVETLVRQQPPLTVHQGRR